MLRMYKLDIYTFDSFGGFFRASIEAKKKVNSKLSYEAVGRKLGLRARSSLIMVANGSRQPSRELLHKICDFLELEFEERLFAHFLVEHAKANTNVERELFRKAKELFLGARIRQNEMAEVGTHLMKNELADNL